MYITIYYIFRKAFCICLFTCYAICGYSSEAPWFNDSLINDYIFNAKFSDALKLIDQNKQQQISDEVRTLLLLKESDIQLKLGNITVSEQLLDESISIISTVQNQSRTLKLQYALQKGNFLLFTGRLKEAGTFLKQAENLLIYVNDPGSERRLYSLLGDYYDMHRDIKNSLRYYEQAARVKWDHPQGKIMTRYYLSCLARLYRKNDELEKADSLYKACLDFLNARVDPFHPGLLETYLNLISYYTNDNINITTAEELFQKSLRILKNDYPGNHYIYGMLFNLKSRIEYMKNDFESVLRYCNYSLKIAEQYSFLNNIRRSNFSTLAQVYNWHKVDYEKAIFYANNAINITTHESESYLYYIIGLAHMSLHNTVQARYNLERVISITINNTSYSEQIICVRALNALGALAWSENNTDQTFYNYRKALRILDKIQVKNNLTSILNTELSRSYLLLTKEYEKALFHAQQGIITGCRTFSDTSRFANPEISDIRSTNSLINALTLKAYILYVLYEKNESLQYLEESLKCQEISVQLHERMLFRIDEENSGLIVVDREEKVRAINNAVSYATLLYLRTGEMKYGEKALKYAEKSKMQLLQMSTQKKSIQRLFNLPDSLINREERLDHDIIEIENNLALQERNSKSGMSTLLLDQLTGLYESRTILLNSMEKKYPSYYKAKFNFNMAGVNEIQKMLDEDEVILEYQLISTEIITFVISRNDFNIHLQLNDSKTSQEIQTLHKFLTVEPLQQETEAAFSSFFNASSYLYSKLIEPIYEIIRNKRLIIIPHNELTQIPFDILISEKPKERSHSNYRNLHYLIREFPIVYAYSANLLLENKDERVKFGKGTAIFLPEYNDSTRGFQPLKGAAAEAAVIKKLSHGKIYRNGDATEGYFKSRAGSYRILHIASHTLLDLQNPSLSCMVMTQEDTAHDGLLYSYEISQMKLNAQLVMLSGCNTGYGLLRRSEGLISIARSFFYTGVRTIGYTLWPVADNAGFDLVQRFYKQLKKHRTLDVALRNSKLDFLQMADPVKTHPYYWASYIIVGRTEKVPLRKYPLFAQIAGMVVVTSILILVFRKTNH